MIVKLIDWQRASWDSHHYFIFFGATILRKVLHICPYSPLDICPYSPSAEHKIFRPNERKIRVKNPRSQYIAPKWDTFRVWTVALVTSIGESADSHPRRWIWSIALLSHILGESHRTERYYTACAWGYKFPWKNAQLSDDMTGGTPPHTREVSCRKVDQ